MGSKNKQQTSKLAQASVTRRAMGKNTLADAISGVNTGLTDSLSTVLKSGVCSMALGTVVGSGMFVAPAAYAQDAAGTIEEVTVMGIRGSLKRALDLKRDADGIVDAISAEDMGKFPDTNLAESLQRITGVSIDRSRGEGSKITVRGLGPDFNLVLFNGRQMPTQSGTGRSFDFANIASEGVSSVEVYKSSNAKLTSGGMGATVNVSTTKPLRNPGLSASAGVKFVHDESTETGNSLTPEISGLYSNTFADDTIGVALTASLQKRDSGQNTANVGPGWRSFRGTDIGANTLPTNASQTNRPTGDDIYGVPQNTGYRVEEFERERINGQLTLQWSPIDSLTATVDYTYAELDLSRRFSDLSAWYGGSGQVTTYNDGPLASPLIYSEQPGQGDFAMAIGSDASINENNSVGINLEWQPTERLALVLDYHDSDAESRPDSRFGSGANLTLASYNRIGTTTYFNAGEIPVLQVNLDASANPNGQRLDADTMQVSGSVFTNNLNRMEIEQTSLSGNFEINDLSSVDFGVQLTKIENRAASSNVQRNTWGQSPAAVGELSDVLSAATIEGRFDELSGGDDSRLQTDYFTASLETLVGRIEDSIASDQNDVDLNGRPDGLDTWSPAGAIGGNGTLGDCGTGFCASSIYDTDRRANEDTEAIYAQYNLSLDTAMPIDLHIGVRYEETEVESPASVPQVSQVVWTATNEFSLQTGGPNIVTLQTGEYDHVLPNFDISVDVFEDVKARFSYSQSISRANFDQLNGGLVPSLLARVDGADAQLGSPGINPLESTNMDLSIEWYFTEESYFSVGYFKKEVDNFIGSTTLRDQLLYPGVTTPVGGIYWNDAITLGGCLTSDLACIRADIFARHDGDPGVSAAGGTIEGIASDPEILFDVGTNVNLNKVDIDGWEIAVQHPFGDSGFGGIINATMVDASTGYNLLSLEDQFVITGLSDSANLIAYYEKEGVQARIAYNWRDDFLNGVGHDTGAREPRITEAYAQWDFSASYEVDEFLTVFIEGINITNETTREHGRTELQVLNASQTGARYNFGVRYTL